MMPACALKRAGALVAASATLALLAATSALAGTAPVTAIVSRTTNFVARATGPESATPVYATTSGYIGAACAPTLAAYRRYGNALTTAMEATPVIAPAFDSAGDVFLATPSTSGYFTNIEEVQPNGAHARTFAVPTTSDLQFAVSNGYLAYVEELQTPTITFIDIVTGSTSSDTLAAGQAIYKLAAIRAGFVLTTQFAGAYPSAAHLQTFTPSGQRLGSVTLHDAPSALDLQAVALSAYVVATNPTPDASGAYPSELYTLNIATGAIAGPVAFHLPAPNDEFAIEPNGDLLFWTSSDQASTIELLHPGASRAGSGAQTPPTTLWHVSQVVNGNIVSDGINLWSGGGLHPVQGPNGTITFTGTPGLLEVSGAEGSTSSPLLQSIGEPLWPLAAGPFGVVVVSQGASNDLVISSLGGSLLEDYPLELPPNTAINAWTYDLAGHFVMLSPLFPGEAVTWPPSCTAWTGLGGVAR
jgi:hypothetical protein